MTCSIEGCDRISDTGYGWFYDGTRGVGAQRGNASWRRTPVHRIRKETSIVSRTLNFIVHAVRVESVDVTQFGQEEPDVIGGPTYVEFANASGDHFDLEWTWRGEPPIPGSKWTLTEQAS